MNTIEIRPLQQMHNSDPACKVRSEQFAKGIGSHHSAWSARIDIQGIDQILHRDLWIQDLLPHRRGQPHRDHLPGGARAVHTGKDREGHEFAIRELPCSVCARADRLVDDALGRLGRRLPQLLKGDDLPVDGGYKRWKEEPPSAPHTQHVR